MSEDLIRRADAWIESWGKHPARTSPDVELVRDMLAAIKAQRPQDNNCGNCHKCCPGTIDRMILCPTCGNKRCPKASDHALPCTNSNEPGQDGSVYADHAAQRPAAQDDRAAFEAWFDSEYVELARIVGDGVAASIRNVSRNAWQVALASRPVPPPISEAQREPLTDEQLHDVLRQVAESIDSGHIVMTHWPQVARAIERAITGQSPE